MVRYAGLDDFELLKKWDKHIDEKELQNSIIQKHVLICSEEKRFIGWLRYNLFWDQIPFMNMLFICEESRRKNKGSEILDFWEKEMVSQNYEWVLTSTRSDEQGQFFYRKKGYSDCGCLTLPNEPLEILLMKKL